MKREEKSLLSRQKILDCALQEFAEQGYGRSSVNTICSAGALSKGILYHYFHDKDELYLLCVQELFDDLTAHLSAALETDRKAGTMQLEAYFGARTHFFQTHPLYHKLFCDVVISPPPHLAQAIVYNRTAFDLLNIEVLTTLLQTLPLREDVTVETAVETFRLYQDFITARFQMEAKAPIDPTRYEQTCKRSLDILLYGVIDHKEV